MAEVDKAVAEVDKAVAEVDKAVAEEDGGVADEDQRVAVASNHKKAKRRHWHDTILQPKKKGISYQVERRYFKKNACGSAISGQSAIPQQIRKWR